MKILRGKNGPSLIVEKKEYNGDQLEICLSGLGPEGKVIKCTQLLH